MNLILNKEPVITDDQIINEIPMSFKYNDINFYIEQLSVHDFELLEKLAYTDFKLIVLPEIPDLFPNVNDNSLREYLELILIQDKKGRYKRFKTITKILGKLIQCESYSKYFKLIIDNIIKHVLKPRYWFFTIRNMLIKKFSLEDLINFIIRLHGYNSFCKKKAFSLVTEGIGNLFIENLPASVKKDSLGKSSNLGTITESVINILKSGQY